MLWLAKPNVAFPITLLVVAYASIEPIFGVGFGSGFGETSIATLYSVLLLAATSWVCFKVAKQRKGQTSGSESNAAFFWRFVGYAFAFLALDEGLQIHENLDKLLHSILGIEETAWTDRIDDLIVLAYGLAGAAVLVKYRAELLRVPSTVWYLMLAFCLFLTSVAFDALSNRDEYLDWLGLQSQSLMAVSFIALLAEEGGKLFAATALFVGFACALQPDGSSSNEPHKSDVSR